MAQPQPVISGVGEAHPVRRSGLRVQSLLWHAIDGALADAGLDASQVDGLVTESTLTPQALPADTLIPAMGLDRLRHQSLSGPYGSGILLALAHAHEAVRAGLATHVLTYFGTDWGSYGTGPAGLHGSMAAKAAVEYPIGFGGPQLYFALLGHRYAHDAGLDTEQLTDLLGQVATSARRNAQRHTYAQQRRPLTMTGYRAEPYFAEPLRRSDISLLSDGAVALVVSDSAAVAPESRLVSVSAWAHRVEPLPDQSFYTQAGSLPRLGATARVAEVFAAAGTPVDSVDLLELYDCYSIATVLQLEALGVTPPGGTLEGVASGALDVGGSLPTNTHGGLLAHGYLLGAAHAVEAVRQLRHEALGNQVHDAASAFVGAGPGRQYTGLLLRRTDA